MSERTESDEPREVDPWRFAGSFLSKLLSARIPDEPSHAEIPWTPVSKPLSESKVALLSTAGLSMAGDEPFDMEGEVGAMADVHYSIMGFQGNDTSVLENESAPAIAAAMQSEEVDLALLAPV